MLALEGNFSFLPEPLSSVEAINNRIYISTSCIKMRCTIDNVIMALSVVNGLRTLDNNFVPYSFYILLFRRKQTKHVIEHYRTSTFLFWKTYTTLKFCCDFVRNHISNSKVKINHRKPKYFTHNISFEKYDHIWLYFERRHMRRHYMFLLSMASM